MGWLLLAVAVTVASGAWLVVTCRAQPPSRMRAFLRLTPPAITFVVAGSALEAAGSRYGESMGSVAQTAATVAMSAMFLYAIWKVSRVRGLMQPRA